MKNLLGYSKFLLIITMTFSLTACTSSQVVIDNDPVMQLDELGQSDQVSEVFIDENETFSINYPTGTYVTEESFDSFYLWPNATEEESTPPPYMTITTTSTSLDDLIADNAQYAQGVIDINDISHQGRRGKRFDYITLQDGEEVGRCSTYYIEDTNKVYIFRLWECMDYDGFEGVISSFRVLE